MSYAKLWHSRAISDAGQVKQRTSCLFVTKHHERDKANALHFIELGDVPLCSYEHDDLSRVHEVQLVPNTILCQACEHDLRYMRANGWNYELVLPVSIKFVMSKVTI